MSGPHRNSDESSSSDDAVATVDVSVKMADTEAALKPVGAAALGLISDKDSLPIRWHTPNPFEAVTFWHVTPLISRGHVRRLEPEDLCQLPEMESERLASAFDRDWAAERAKNPDKPSLVRACLVGSRPTFIFTGVLYLLAQATRFSGPLLLRRIVEAIECNEAGGEDCASTMDMYVFALIMTLAGVVQNFCQAQQDFYMQRLGVRVRNRLMCALYRKCLKLSPQGLQEETTGKIVTLMSNDVNKLQDLFQLLHNLWGAPIFIVASFVMLYDVIQWSSFVGFACIIVAAPMTFLVAKTLFEIRKKLLVCADGRINILSEVINGMRVIKYYAWESAFAARVREIRDKEVKLIWASQRVGALFGVALFSTPVFIAVCSLGSYSLAGKTLSASTAYTALALFNMLRFPLILVPFLLTTLLNALSAVQRLGAFLLQDESPVVPPDMSDPGRVIVNDATFRWPKAPKKPEEAPPAKPLKKGAKKPTKQKKGVPVKGEDDAPAFLPHRVVKLKAGVLAPERDAARVRDAVRKHYKVRVDANRRWSREQYEAFLAHLGDAPLDFVEEPPFSSSNIPAALDETLAETDWSPAFDEAEVLVAKPALIGLERTLALARLHKRVVASSCFEAGAGLAHVASIGAALADDAHGLGTYAWLAEDPFAFEELLDDEGVAWDVASGEAALRAFARRVVERRHHDH